MFNKKLLGCKINRCDYKEILLQIDNCIKNKKRLNITYVNAYIVLFLKNNLNFRKHVKSFYLYTDGIGMFWAKRILHGGNVIRSVATDLNSLILELAEREKFRVFFYGGSSHATKMLGEKLFYLFPTLIVTGIFGRESQTNDELIDKLNTSKSDILFVGLGTPQQEEWIARNKNKVNIPVKIAVGSGIDYLAGTYKRAPKIMQRIGLEWFFRLIYDPKRLWKRYILGIPYFIYLVLKEYIKSGKK